MVGITHGRLVVLKRTVLGGIKQVVWWFLKNVPSHTDVVGETTEIL